MGAACASACSPWAEVEDVCGVCADYSIDTVLLEDSIAAATDIIYEMSGRRFSGSCRDTVRPCARRLCTPTSADERIPSWWRSSWGTCSCSGDSCGCARLSQITLGGYPLTGIDEVKIDGVVLDDTLYRIDDYRVLVRLPDPDGTNPGWPYCQKLDLPSTEVDTFEVTFTYGVMPPPAGVRAAGALACELALACSPETIGKCRLSRKVRQVARQGVTLELIDPISAEAGRTGLWEVDLFLNAYNPRGLRRRAAVISPDFPPAVRRAGT